jgi:hypothetical protein
LKQGSNNTYAFGVLTGKHFSFMMEFKPGDYVSTPNGNGYVNDVIEDKVLVDLIDGDQLRELFDKDQIFLLAE